MMNPPRASVRNPPPRRHHRAVRAASGVVVAAVLAGCTASDPSSSPASNSPSGSRTPAAQALSRGDAASAAHDGAAGDPSTTLDATTGLPQSGSPDDAGPWSAAEGGDLPDSHDAGEANDASGAVLVADQDATVLGNGRIDGTWQLSTVPNSYVYFIPVVPSDKSWLASVNVVTDTDRSAARMYLYADDNGVPGKFLADTSPFDLTTGSSGQTLVAGSKWLGAGQRYWLGAEFWSADGGTPLYEESSEAGGGAFGYSHAAAGFGGPMPDQLTGAVPLGNVTYSLYVTVTASP